MLLLSDNRRIDSAAADRDPPDVSVIIPAYRSEATIGTALASVASQTCGSIEVIVVDDASRDDTATRACAVLQTSGLPHVVVQLLKNSGPSLARNCGVTLARGRYVAFLDADDSWMPTKLAQQVRLMDRHPEVTLCGCKVELFGQDGASLGLLSEDVPSFQVDGWKRLLWNSFIHTSAAMARRQDLGIRPFDRRLRVAEDRDLWIRLASNGTVGMVQQVLANKLESPTSFMSSNRMLIAFDTRRMIDTHVGAMRRYLTLAERMSVYGSLHSQIGKGLARQPGRYLSSLRHLALAIATGFKVFDNARVVVLSIPALRAARSGMRRPTTSAG